MSLDEPAAATLSAVLITKNEEHCIAACLDALSFADEIVVLDSGSSDRTVEIAQAYGAKVHTASDWPGFGAQKNRTLALATGYWVFSIDADEVVDAKLRIAILNVINAGTVNRTIGQACAGYWVKRHSFYCGKIIRHGDWRNDRVLRFFRRDVARFSDDLVHERVLCPEPHGTLDGCLFHDSAISAADLEEKVLRYARLGAVKLRERGRGGRVSAIVHSGWTFLRGYIVRGGFLDGWRGFAIARQNARGTYWRYLWAARRHDV